MSRGAKDTIISKLSEYFSRRKDMAFAYLFGSIVKGTSHSESDIDVGVYFVPPGRELEYESVAEYPGEDEMWLQIERLLGRQTDLVVLNRAPSALFDAVMRTGVPLCINNENLRTRLF